MKALENASAIVIRRSVWSETSLIVTWLTDRFGSLRTVARGALRPQSAFSGKIDLFYRADIALSFSRSSDLETLREVHLVKPFDASRAGASGFYLASYFAELAGLAAPPMHPAPEILALLDRALGYLQGHPASRRVLDHFERELCRLLGVHDASGRTPIPQALGTLCGTVPASRDDALRFLKSPD